MGESCQEPFQQCFFVLEDEKAIIIVHDLLFKGQHLLPVNLIDIFGYLNYQ